MMVISDIITIFAFEIKQNNKNYGNEEMVFRRSIIRGMCPCVVAVDNRYGTSDLQKGIFGWEQG